MLIEHKEPERLLHSVIGADLETADETATIFESVGGIQIIFSFFFD